MTPGAGKGSTEFERVLDPSSATHRAILVAGQGGEDVARGWVQLLAAVMASVNVAVWVLWSRWERPGRGLELRTRLRAPPVVGRGSDLVQVAPLAYPGDQPPEPDTGACSLHNPP